MCTFNFYSKVWLIINNTALKSMVFGKNRKVKGEKIKSRNKKSEFPWQEENIRVTLSFQELGALERATGSRIAAINLIRGSRSVTGSYYERK